MSLNNYSIPSFFLIEKIYKIGNTPTLLTIAIAINQPKCPLRAAFHNAINFHTISQTASAMSNGINQENSNNVII